MNQNIKRAVQLPSEVSYTYLYVYDNRIRNSNNHKRATINESIEYSLDYLQNKIGSIDWVKLENIPANELNIIKFTFKKYYNGSISLNYRYDKKLIDFINNISLDFKKNKKRAPYRSSAIKLLFRAVMAEDLGILPIKDNKSLNI